MAEGGQFEMAGGGQFAWVFHYRIYPYRIQLDNLRHAGLPDDLTKQYLVKYGKLLKNRIGLSEINAIRYNSGRNHSLEYYYLHLNPFNDYFIDYSNYRFVFLDSQSDAFCHATNYFSRNIYKLYELEQPPSHGLEKKQIEFFNAVAESTKNVLLFCHAPILNTEKSLQGDIAKLPSIEFPKNEKKRFVKEYEQLLIRKGLSLGTIFNNKYAIIGNLRSNSNQTIVFTGHCHRSDQYKLSKTNGTLCRFNSLNAELNNDSLESNIFFYSLSSISHLPINAFEIQEPSFLLLNINGEKIENIVNVNVDETPFYHTKYQMLFIKHADTTEVEFTVENKDGIGNNNKHIYRIIVFSESKEFKNIDNVKIKTIADDLLLINNFCDRESRIFWIYEMKKSNAKIVLDNSIKGLQYYFSIELLDVSNSKIKSKGIRRFSIPFEN